MAATHFRRPTAVALVLLLLVFIAATVTRQEARQRLRRESANNKPTPPEPIWGGKDEEGGGKQGVRRDSPETADSESGKLNGGNHTAGWVKGGGSGGKAGKAIGEQEHTRGLRGAKSAGVKQLPKEGSKVAAPEWRGAQQAYAASYQGQVDRGPAPASRPRGVDEGGTLSPMDMAPGMPFGAAMLDTP